MVNTPSFALHPAAATGMAVKSRSDMTRVIIWKQPAVPVYFQTSQLVQAGPLLYNGKWHASHT